MKFDLIVCPENLFIFVSTHTSGAPVTFNLLILGIVCFQIHIFVEGGGDVI